MDFRRSFGCPPNPLRQHPSSKAVSQQPPNENTPGVVIGIGASAGGVEALGLFFDHERGGTGAAFLVVMHLSRERASHLPDILTRHTDMPVLTAKHGMLVEAERIYVMPPGVFMTVSEGRLQLSPATVAERAPSVIDRFFNSLAERYGDRAIGIVLSGTGTDGAVGLKSIKERGGLTIAQAEGGTVPLFSGMPKSAIATGAVDLQLSVEEMGPRLSSAIRDITQPDRAAEELDDERLERLRLEIAGLLHAQLKHDFSGYKPSTFLRRVWRRMSVLELVNLEAYVDHLKTTPGEATLLFRDLLISVTSFFRDAEAFDAIESVVIPELFKGKQCNDEVRVWVPGCATGEEAYSLAMLLLEHADAIPDSAPDIRVFATDIDERALSIARRGRYTSVLLESVSETRRKKFFTEDRDTWSVQKRLREACTFSPHNALRDPPFSRIDLVSCRNLLIYLGPEFQNRILPILHYALRPDGFLFVGVAEGITRQSGLFAPVSKAHRIFRKLRSDPGDGALPKLSSNSLRKPVTSFSMPGPQVSSNAMRAQIEARILQAHTPAYVLVDVQGDALFYSGRTGTYLEFSPGAPSRHLLGNARMELRLGLRRALRDAVATQERVVLPPVNLPQESGLRRVQISIEPFDDGDRLLYLVVFNDHGPVPELITNPDDAAAQTIEHLERELGETRDQLQSTYEEFETAIEELRVANEELMSVNEELQSSNEELETSKEELQSLNEELQTVNHEMACNVEALDQSNADLRGLLESTGIATIFLDRQLLIRRFTHAATEIFTLIPSDCGRLITDLNHRLADLNLGERLRETQVQRRSVQRAVARKDGSKHYLMCLLPYKGTSEDSGGVVMTFVDVTAMAEAEVRQKTMIGELNHRVRNMLAVVDAIAMQTLGPVVDDDILAPFLSRLHSMARTYKLLTQTSWSRMALRQLLHEELSVASGSARFTLSGPEIWLNPREALGLGMVLHELTTNAVKYGTLSNETGRVEVTWACDPQDDEVDMIWIERGGPAVAPPTRRGFGTRLIERQLSYELGGTSDVDFAADGLAVKMHIPRLEAEETET